MPASAAVSATVAENPVLKSQNIVHLARNGVPYDDPSLGSVGFKKSRKK